MNWQNPYLIGFEQPKIRFNLSLPLIIKVFWSRQTDLQMQRKSDSVTMPDLAGIPMAWRTIFAQREYALPVPPASWNILIPSTKACSKEAEERSCSSGRKAQYGWVCDRLFRRNVYLSPHTKSWSGDRVPGGSSGGSVALPQINIVFSGFRYRGSIRCLLPCGIVCFKPTLELFLDTDWFHLQLPGSDWASFKDVTDCAIVMNAITGFDSNDRTKRPLSDYTSFKDGVSACELVAKWMA